MSEKPFCKMCAELRETCDHCRVKELETQLAVALRIATAGKRMHRKLEGVCPCSFEARNFETVIREYETKYEEIKAS